MRLLYLLTVGALAAATYLAVAAYEAYEAVAAIRAQNRALVGEIEQLDQEIARFEQVSPSPLKFADEALAEFYTRTVEAGEVLGAGVRIAPRQQELLGQTALNFVELKPGILRCEATLQVAMEGVQAPAILAMFEEELASLPVTVRKLAARKMGRDFSVKMDVDIYGRTP